MYKKQNRYLSYSHFIAQQLLSIHYSAGDKHPVNAKFLELAN